MATQSHYVGGIERIGFGHLQPRPMKLAHCSCTSESGLQPCRVSGYVGQGCLIISRPEGNPNHFRIILVFCTPENRFAAWATPLYSKTPGLGGLGLGEGDRFTLLLVLGVKSLRCWFIVADQRLPCTPACSKTLFYQGILVEI